MRKQADFIEAVMVGAGALFGGGKKISKTLEKIREQNIKNYIALH